MARSSVALINVRNRNSANSGTIEPMAGAFPVVRFAREMTVKMADVADLFATIFPYPYSLY